MLNYDNFAITFGRAIDVFRTSPGSVVQQKGALRALVALSSLGAAAMRVEDGVLRVGGKTVPVTLPFVPGLVERMEAHGVRRLNISRGASAYDLLGIVRGLAADDATALEATTGRFQSVGVDRIEIAPERLGVDRRPASVTTAFDRDQVLREAGESDAALDHASETTADAEARIAGGLESGGVEAQEERADALTEVPDRPSSSDEPDLEIAMLRLAGAPDSDGVDALIAGVIEGVESRLHSGLDGAALEGIACLVNLESQVVSSVTDHYRRGLDRVLSPETLVRVARLVADNRHARYAVAVLHRAGSAGTIALLEQLMKAPSVEEKDAYGAALVAVPEGVEGLQKALDSDDATMVLIAIEQLARLNVSDTVPLLGRLVTAHSDAKVRQAACQALCEMKPTAEVCREVQSLMDGGAALLVARCIGPETPGELVELLVKASEADSDVVTKKAVCRALGRVSSPRATRQLIKMSLAGGRFFGRKPVDVRLAAIEGLGLVQGPAALGTMEELLQDRNSAIRSAAREIIDRREGKS